MSDQDTLALTNSHPASSVEPLRRVDYKSKKHPRPVDRKRTKVHPRQSCKRVLA